MFNLDQESIDLECPKCRFYNAITIQQVRLRDAVICRGCKTTINFDDHMNETRKAVRSINSAFKELEDTMSKIGTLKIKF